MTKRKNDEQGNGHHMITMVLPPSYLEKRIHPFTEAVIEMPANAGRALVYERKDGENIGRAAGMCGSAIRAAKRRDAHKIFETRMIVDRGVETCAVWRLK